MGTWLRGRWLEATIVLIGVALRASMQRTFSVTWGYDFESHMRCVEWLGAHPFSPAPLTLFREAYHPPLYYVIAGGLHAAGVGWQALMSVSLLSGVIKLGVVWAGCELFLRQHRLARLVALALAATMPSALHLEAMVTNEGLSNGLAALAMWVAALAFRARRRLRLALALGLLLGLNLLTKVSALALIGAFGAAALLELALVATERRARALALLAALGVCCLVSGWYFARNQHLYGKPFLSGFDGRDGEQHAAVLSRPYLEKRPPMYYLGWTSDIFESPYYPAGVWPVSRFFPALVASTFVDAYNYGFARRPWPGAPFVIGCYKPLPPAALTMSRLSVTGGTLIAAITVCGWLAIFAWAWRGRRMDHIALLLVPLFGLLGQMHFATAFPIDAQGPVKGLYFQFAAPPLYLVFGRTVEWLWRRNLWTWAVAVAGLLGLAFVVAYTLYCRVIAPF